jgi:hypothetical protein
LQLLLLEQQLPLDLELLLLLLYPSLRRTHTVLRHRDRP